MESIAMSLEIAALKYSVTINDSNFLINNPRIVISGNGTKPFSMTVYPNDDIWEGFSCPVPNLTEFENTVYLYDDDILICSKTKKSISNVIPETINFKFDK